MYSSRPESRTKCHRTKCHQQWNLSYFLLMLFHFVALRKWQDKQDQAIGGKVTRALQNGTEGGTPQCGWTDCPMNSKTKLPSPVQPQKTTQVGLQSLGAVRGKWLRLRFWNIHRKVGQCSSWWRRRLRRQRERSRPIIKIYTSPSELQTVLWQLLLSQHSLLPYVGR